MKSESFLRQKYCLEGLSIDQIAAMTFSSKCTIRQTLKRFGIARRYDMPTGRPPSYGYRRVQGRLIPCEAEQKILQQIAELRKQGFSYLKIADLLRAMKVPTKKLKRNWNRDTIRKLLERSRTKSGENKY